MKKTDKTVQLFSKNIFSKSKSQLLTMLREHCSEGTTLLTIFTPNPEQIMLATTDKSFDFVLGQADVLIPDGIGLVGASRFFALLGKNTSITERITGVELATDLLKEAARQNKTVLIIGGRNYAGATFVNSGTTWKISEPPVSEKVSSAKKQTKVTDEHTLYWLEGFSDVKKQSVAEQERLEEVLLTCKPAIVFVCFGAPYQEQWVIAQRAVLEKAGVRVAMVVGGAFDMLLGKVKRAPIWAQKSGFEWLFRLTQEPWRMRRQTQLIRFVWLTLKEAFRIG